MTRHEAPVSVDQTFQSATSILGEIFPIHQGSNLYTNSAISIEEETDRREGKGRHCCLGDEIEGHTSHLAGRMTSRKL